MPETAADKITNVTASDMRDYMYGAIQEMIQANVPKNVVFQYYLPAIPFGPELAAYMDIGPKAKEWREQGFTVNDLMRSAVNFAVIADYVPVVDETVKGGKPTGEIVDINTLISSGTRISELYKSILSNVRVFDNARSEKDEEQLEKLRALLYKDTPERVPSKDADPVLDADDASVDTLTADLDAGDDFDLDADLGLNDLDGDDGDDEFDLDSLLDDGLGTDDLVVNPNAISEPTTAMKLYDALLMRFNEVQLQVADALKKISPNDPNASLRKKVLLRKLRAARQRWETQGRKTKIEAIMARIDQLSRGGMPEYLQELRETFEGNKLLASVFADEEEGLGALSEVAYYTALRPNGVLSAKSGMRVSLSNSNSSTWRKMESSKTSGSVNVPIGAILRVKGGLEKFNSQTQSEFFSEEFEISFEIVQALIDRPWFAKNFVESRAYTTVDPRTDAALDPVMQIISLSNGGNPPKGMMPALPVTVYFIRDLRVRSSALARMSDHEVDSIKGSGGVSIFGFGAKAGHENKTVETSYSKAGSMGEITANGTYLVAMSSVFMEQCPNPDFEAFPKDHWI